MALSNNLKEARIKKGYKQEELAALVGKSKNVISNWERGDNKPDADTLFKLCDILDVDANYLLGWENNQNLSLSISEQSLIKKFRSLSVQDQETVEILIDRLCIREAPAEFIAIQPSRLIDWYPHLASAGTGQYLFDDIPVLKKEVDDDCEADFIVGVNGDSMEPTFFDEDDLLIKKQETVLPGEIGLFIVDGECVVKEYQKDRLVSHNKKYEDIVFNDYMNIICVGKVIGKLGE